MGDDVILNAISDSMPLLGGVEPRHRSLKNLKDVFIRQQVNIRDAGEEIFFWLDSFKRSAAQAGMGLTVSDLSNLIGLMLERFKGNLEEKSIKQPLLPPIYKGVSFNPKSFQGHRSEWLVILDFFSLMRQAISEQPSDRQPLQFSILDAGLYWLVNIMGAHLVLTERQSQNAANQMIRLLFEAMEDKRFSEVVQTNRVRNAYLKAIANEFPANHTPVVFGLRDIWEDVDFEEILSQAIKLFCSYQGGRWQVVNPVKYNRYMMYSPWVTVLVASEVAIVTEKTGFSSELAPTAEAAWSKVLGQIANQLNFQHIIWMYKRKLAENMSYDSLPAFSDSLEEIQKKLSSKEAMENNAGPMVIRLIAPFLGKDWYDSSIEAYRGQNWSCLAQNIFAFTSQVEKKVEDITSSSSQVSSLPLVSIPWLTNFPPGIC